MLKVSATEEVQLARTPLNARAWAHQLAAAIAFDAYATLPRRPPASIDLERSSPMVVAATLSYSPSNALGFHHERRLRKPIEHIVFIVWQNSYLMDLHTK